MDGIVVVAVVRRFNNNYYYYKCVLCDTKFKRALDSGKRLSKFLKERDQKLFLGARASFDSREKKKVDHFLNGKLNCSCYEIRVGFCCLNIADS